MEDDLLTLFLLFWLFGGSLLLLFGFLLGLLLLFFILVLRHDNLTLLDVNLGYNEVAVLITLALLSRHSGDSWHGLSWLFSLLIVRGLGGACSGSLWLFANLSDG